MKRLLFAAILFAPLFGLSNPIIDPKPKEVTFLVSQIKEGKEYIIKTGAEIKAAGWKFYDIKFTHKTKDSLSFIIMGTNELYGYWESCQTVLTSNPQVSPEQIAESTLIKTTYGTQFSCVCRTKTITRMGEGCGPVGTPCSYLICVTVIGVNSWCACTDELD